MSANTALAKRMKCSYHALKVRRSGHLKWRKNSVAKSADVSPHHRDQARR